MMRFAWLLTMTAAIGLGGCAAQQAADTEATATPGEPAYFDSPRSAVREISKMLRAERWAELARYYDLSAAGIDRGELTSGRYFITADTAARELPPPENELAKFRHPFHPSYTFFNASVTDQPNVALVTVMLEIDQGEGTPPRRTIDHFYMKKHDQGWQILPGGDVE